MICKKTILLYVFFFVSKYKMSVTVKQLSSAIVKNKDIDSFVRDQLRAIDVILIKTRAKWGHNLIKYEISNIFNFLGLEREQAEKIVYSKIMKNLEKRGFTVKIKLGHDKSTMYITWITGIENGDESELNSYLIKRTITSDYDVKPNLSIRDI